MLWLLQINFNFLFSGSKSSSNAKPWQANMKTLSQQKPLAGEPPSLNNEAKEEEKAEKGLKKVFCHKFKINLIQF